MYLVWWKSEETTALRLDMNGKIKEEYWVTMWQMATMEAGKFFLLGFQNCLSCVYSCDDQPRLHIFNRSSNIWSFTFHYLPVDSFRVLIVF